MDALISSSSGKQTTVTLAIKALSPPEKRRRALKELGLFWGLALVTLPLPPVHWVSVPGFFFFGLYRAWKRLGEKEAVLPATLSCPECGSSFPMAERAYSEAWEVVCPHCRWPLQVAPKAQRNH